MFEKMYAYLKGSVELTSLPFYKDIKLPFTTDWSDQ